MKPSDEGVKRPREEWDIGADTCGGTFGSVWAHVTARRGIRDCARTKCCTLEICNMGTACISMMGWRAVDVVGKFGLPPTGHAPAGEGGKGGLSGGEGRVQGRGGASGNTGAHLLRGAAPRALELEDECAARKTRRKSQKSREKRPPTSFYKDFVWRTGV